MAIHARYVYFLDRALVLSSFVVIPQACEPSLPRYHLLLMTFASCSGEHARPQIWQAVFLGPLVLIDFSVNSIGLRSLLPVSLFISFSPPLQEWFDRQGHRLGHAKTDMRPSALIFRVNVSM